MVPDEDVQLTFDILGNRLTLNHRVGSEIVYTSNVVNEYTAIGGVAPLYDACGNLTKDIHGYTYHYDNDNRITQIKKNNDADEVAAYTYDALGRRIRKYDAVAAAAVRCYYDDQRVLLETDDSNSDQRAFVYGNYIDEVLIMTDYTVQDDPDYFYGQDHLYSTVALFDDAGAVIERYEYDAYGQVRIMDASYNSRTGSSYGNTYLFTGRRLDTLDSGALKIYYYRARYYDPEIGRFLQRDPLDYVDGMNLYEYVGNSPVLLNDAFGLVSTGDGTKWAILGTPLIPFGHNSIYRTLSADADEKGCKFIGSPELTKTLTHRALWSGKIVDVEGPTLYHKSKHGCCDERMECYKYVFAYKWYSGALKPPGVPKWIPWPFVNWMATEIKLDICADGIVYHKAKDTASSDDYIAQEFE